jgi:hypothetical protein
VVSFTSRLFHYRGKETPVPIGQSGGWASRASLGTVEESKISCLCQESRADSLVRSESLYRLSCPGSCVLCTGLHETDIIVFNILSDLIEQADSRLELDRWSVRITARTPSIHNPFREVLGFNLSHDHFHPHSSTSWFTIILLLRDIQYP